MTQTSQFERDRAKRLYAAVMSSRNGTSLAREYKRLKQSGDRELTGFWFQLAEEIDLLLSEQIAKMLQPEKAGMVQ
jgi:hypothetical protein